MPRVLLRDRLLAYLLACWSLNSLFNLLACWSFCCLVWFDLVLDKLLACWSPKEVDVAAVNVRFAVRLPCRG